MFNSEQVRRLLVANLGVGVTAVVDTAKLHDDLGADSLDTIDLAIAIDAEFDVMASDEEMDAVVTVKDLIDLVEKLIKEKPNG